MELFRPAAASTYISFPIADATGFALSGKGPLTGTWMAWGDTAGATSQGNPGFRTLTGAFNEIAATGVYGGFLASTELPAASPYVMLRFTGTSVATQYLLIRTASLYTNITGINGTNIVAPVTAGTMPIDQGAALSGATAGSVGQSLLRINYATVYVDAAISSRSAPASLQTIDQTTAIIGTTAGSIGQVFLRMNYATDSFSTLSTRIPSALTITSGAVNMNEAQTLTIPSANGGTVGRALVNMNYATVYLDQKVSTASAGAVWDEPLSTHVTAGSYGESLNVVRRSTAQAGTTYSITLDASASATDQAYKDMMVWIWTGGGANQGGLISNYNGTTKVASLYNAVATTFSGTSVFQIIPSAGGTAAPANFASMAITTGGAVNVNEAQALTIPAAAGGTVGKSLVNMNYATVYLDAQISAISGLGLGTTLNLINPTDNTVGKALSRLYYATNYLDAQISTISGLGLGSTLNLINPTDNTVGKALSQMYFATRYLDAAVSTRSAPATAQTIDQTTAISGGTAGSIGATFDRLKQATVYLDAAVSTRSAPASLQTIDQTTAISGGTVGSIGATFDRMKQATVYLDAAVSSRSTVTTAQILTTALTEAYAADGATATISQLLYMIWAMQGEKAISSTTLTAKKLDGSTPAMTFTLDSSSSPTSITRAT